LLASCQGILDKEPIATLDAGSFFQTEADAVQALNAAYQPLLFSNENNNFYWAFAEVTSDEAITGGDGSRPGIAEMDAFTFTPRTEEFNTFWKLQYAGITQCNLVLDNVPDIAMNESRRNQIIGEALFLRSYYYFLLTQVFGDVPLFTKVVPPDELKVPKTPKPSFTLKLKRIANGQPDCCPINTEEKILGVPPKAQRMPWLQRPFYMKRTGKKSWSMSAK